jgi:hypothetical protein
MGGFGVLMTYLRMAVLGLMAVAFAACGGGGSSSSGSQPPNTNGSNQTPDPASPEVVDTFAYRSDSPYAAVLQNCTYAGSETDSCTLSTLPFLGQDASDPTIEDVLDRVLVSHTWMGDNLETFLEALPSDLLLMLRSVTAVVIASDIRPAFYNPETGAIYLDADYLWLTQDEAAVVTDEEDFRANFGDPLQFAMPWRYVRNNERLTVAINPDGSRDPDGLLPILGFLLYHELAHAVDFMPQSELDTVDLELTAQTAIIQAQWLSNTWADPLVSDTLKDLAAVSFRGATATAEQEAIEPAELVSEFANDGAIQYYAYTTQFEDLATMFETVMMLYHFDFEKDTGITTNTEFSNDGLVAWGQRGRVSDQASYARALAALQALYPGELAPVEAFLAQLPAPIQMPEGVTWGETLNVGSQISAEEQGLDKRTRDDVLSRRPIR